MKPLARRYRPNNDIEIGHVYDEDEAADGDEQEAINRCESRRSTPVGLSTKAGGQELIG
jgi:hypothetical protein